MIQHWIICPFLFFSPPNSKCLVLLMDLWFFHLQVASVHSIFNTSFLVVLALRLKMGLDCPPKPACLASYLLLPWDILDSADFLYWVTFILTCFLHLPQYVFLTLGMFTILNKEERALANLS